MNLQDHEISTTYYRKQSYDSNQKQARNQMIKILTFKSFKE